MKINVFRGKDGWRWNLQAKNGRLIATSGESFHSHYNALRAARRMHALMPGTVLHEGSR